MASNGFHIAVIPDGNRRWARERGLLPWEGHDRAVENLRDITEWCRNDPRVSILTVWCFSTENWKRDPREVKKLMELLEEYLEGEREDLKRKGTRFLHSGRSDRIPASLAKLLRDVSGETSGEVAFTLHLAVDYGGKDEVVRAVRKIGAGNTVFEESLRTCLDHPELPDIDLVIRTSGERRTSNFFLWQSAYAEWVFLEKFFPDLTAGDMEKALEDFGHRERNFGA